MADKQFGPTRNEIFEAARRLTFEAGSSHVTVSRLARELGQSGSALGGQIKDNRELWLFLINETGQEFARTIEEQKSPGLNPIQVLEKIMRQHLAEVLLKRSVFFLILARSLSSGDKAILRRQAEVLEGYIRQIEGVLDEGIKSGIFRPDTDSAAAAKLFFGMILNLVDTSTLRQEDKDLEKEFLAAWGLFQKAIFNTSYEQTA